MSEVLLTGLKIGESARWHDGRLWLSNWGTQQVLAVDLDGNTEVKATAPTTIPFSIDWLPDGRLLVVAGPEGRLLRQEPDGSLVGGVALCRPMARESRSLGLGSDRYGQLIECNRQPPSDRLLHGQLVEATSDVLHERVSGDDHGGVSVPLESPHRP
jgi:hypothetical protein